MPVYMRKSVLKCKFSSFYACSTIKIGHHKVEFFTWIKTKSDKGGSKKREIIGCHLWIAPNQDFSFDPNVFFIYVNKNLFHSLYELCGPVDKAQDAWSAAECGCGFESHLWDILKIFFSLLEKRGGRTLKFLGCLTPEWQNAWLLKN